MRPSVLARLLLVVTALLTLALIVLVVLLELDASYEPADSLTDSLPDIIMTLSFVIVGAVVTIKRPDNLVGWALSLAGLGLLVSGVLGLYAELALFAKPEQELPGGGVGGRRRRRCVDTAHGRRVPASRGLPFRPGILAALAHDHDSRARRLRSRLGARHDSTGELDPLRSLRESAGLHRQPELLAIAWVLIGACLVAIAAAAVSLLRRFRRSRGRSASSSSGSRASAGCCC